MGEVDEFLAHYGVKGMRWGVRKDRSGRSSGSESNKKRPVRGGVLQVLPGDGRKRGGVLEELPGDNPGKKYQRGESGGRETSTDGGKSYRPDIRPVRSRTTDRLTDDELKKTVARMQLEKQYAELSALDQTSWQRIKRRALRSIGDYAFNATLGEVNKRIVGPVMGELFKTVAGASKPSPKKDPVDKAAPEPKSDQSSKRPIKVEIAPGQNGNKPTKGLKYMDGPELRDYMTDRFSGVWDKKIVDIGSVDTSILGDVSRRKHVVQRRPKQNRRAVRRKTH